MSRRNKSVAVVLLKSLYNFTSQKSTYSPTGFFFVPDVLLDNLNL